MKTKHKAIVVAAVYLIFMLIISFREGFDPGFWIITTIFMACAFIVYGVDHYKDEKFSVGQHVVYIPDPEAKCYTGFVKNLPIADGIHPGLESYIISEVCGDLIKLEGHELYQHSSQFKLIDYKTYSLLRRNYENN